MMVVVAIEVACLRAAVHVVLATGREAVVAALSFQDGPAVRGEEVFFPKFHRDALVGNRLLVHRYALRLPLLIPVLRIHLVEHGTRDNRRCQCNNPHQQQQEALTDLQRTHQMLDDGIGGYEQRGQQRHKERHEEPQMNTQDGLHVPREELRHGVGRINGEHGHEQ